MNSHYPALDDQRFHNTLASEQRLYDHLLECVRTESPERVLDRFKGLFIYGRGYDHKDVWQALTEIVSSKESASQFTFILNRCCHILINKWQIEIKSHIYIHQLLEAFQELPPPVSSKKYIKSFSAHLQDLVNTFVRSEQFKQLKRLATILDERSERNKPANKQLVGNLIDRYPYLYDHCLLSSESSIEQQQTVYKVKAQLEKEFEVNLSKYVTYQVRMAQYSCNRELNLKGSQIIQPVSNPTLLSNRDLGKSLKRYVGNVENGYSYQDLSRSFVAYTSDVRNYQLFKDDLYEYIVQSIDPQYGKHRFNKKLYEKLQVMYPQYNQSKPDEFLKMRTYSQLFNYMIVESPSNPQHLVFMDMISNMGTTKTIGLFLQLVLACSKVKPYLEKRFSILFNHYESFTRETASWLVKCLEKMNLAFIVNFGSVDMSFLKRMYSKT